VGDCTCGPGVRWCARADALFDVPGMHVLDVDRDKDGRQRLTVETDQTVTGCPSCGVVAVGHGRREHRVHDAPCFGTPSVVVWRKRVWRCVAPACPVVRFSETHDLVPPRARLTSRAVGWAVDALSHDDTTIAVAALAAASGWTGTPAGMRSRSRPPAGSPTPSGWSE
jgi:transposase